MKNIVRYTSQTPIKKILEDFRGLLYSKHSDWRHQVLKDEEPLIEKAMKIFVEQVGFIQSKRVTWRAVYIDGSCPYINFENVADGSLTNYFDMEEIDRRYIDSRIDEWMKL